MNHDNLTNLMPPWWGHFLHVHW